MHCKSDLSYDASLHTTMTHLVHLRDHDALQVCATSKSLFEIRRQWMHMRQHNLIKSSIHGVAKAMSG